jgi:hypothetical protein
MKNGSGVCRFLATNSSAWIGSSREKIKGGEGGGLWLFIAVFFCAEGDRVLAGEKIGRRRCVGLGRGTGWSWRKKLTSGAQASAAGSVGQRNGSGSGVLLGRGRNEVWAEMVPLSLYHFSLFFF